MASIDKMVSGLGQTIGTAIQNRKNREAQERDAAQRFKVINQIDWEPMYASTQVPTYQKSQSPIARSYLESFLLGNNPDSTRSTAPNASLVKGQQQLQQNAMFGTPEQRVARAQEVQQATPWAVQAPTRPIVTPQMQNAEWTAKHPEMAQYGIYSEEDFNKVRDAGGFGSFSPGPGGKPEDVSPFFYAIMKNGKDARKGQRRIDEILGRT